MKFLFYFLALGLKEAFSFFFLFLLFLRCHALPGFPENADAFSQGVSVSSYTHGLAQSYTTGEDFSCHLLQYVSGTSSRQLLQLLAQCASLNLVTGHSLKFGVAYFGF
ncbi:MAG TPA: hypothetical protein VFY14_04190 [Streptomyces sp.]|nr:hypothetical protein [Streptomyces sp.]